MLKSIYNDTKPELAGRIVILLLSIFKVVVSEKTSSTFFNFLLTSYSFPLAAMNMENLEGDYYVPGNELDLGDGVWKEIQAGLLNIFLSNKC